MNNEQLRSEKIVLEREQKEIIFFDANKEIGYLKEIEPKRRMVAFGQELETAMQELFWIQSEGLNRVLKDGRLKDPVTDCFLDEIVWKGKNNLEIKAFSKIQENLRAGNDLVIHFSPANKDLDYSGNLVDFWISNKDKQQIKYIRFFVKDNFSKFKRLYKFLGGKEINSKEEMLANPLVVDNEIKMAQIMKNLVLVNKRSNRVTAIKIKETIKLVLNEFLEEYGDSVFEDEELIDRIYGGVQDILLKDRDIDDIEVRREVIEIDISNYKFADIIGRQEIMGGGFCPGKAISLVFGEGKGMIVKKVNGELVIKEGNTEGLTKCELCGYYYIGNKCPLCN